MTEYEIRIGSPDTSSSDYVTTISDFSGLSINENHTALTDWDVSVPWRKELRDYVLEPIYVYRLDNDTVFYSGYLEAVEDNSTKDGTAKLYEPQSDRFIKEADEGEYSLELSSGSTGTIRVGFTRRETDIQLGDTVRYLTQLTDSNGIV